MKRVMTRGMLTVAFLGVVWVGPTALADTYSGGSYVVNGTFGASTGSSSSAGSYKLTSTSGESIIGKGTGGSYRVGFGYTSQLETETPALRMSVQPTGLALYYPFEEGAATRTYDGSANALTATLSNVTWTTGKLGGALTLNGTNAQTTTTYAAAENMTGDYTLELWLKPGATSQTTNAKLVGKHNGTTINYLLSFDGSSHVQFIMDCGTRTTTTSTTVFSNTSLWYHVAAVHSGTTMLLYVNGAQEAQASCSGAAQTNLAPFEIGNTVASPGFFNGSVDEVKLFSRAFSGNDIAAGYNAQLSGNAASLAIATIAPGISQAASFNTVVTTNVSGYSLAVNEDHDLSSGSETIPAISAPISTPAAWAEGATKGLGFTLTSAPGLGGGWASGANYAAIPTLSTTFYTRSSYVPKTTDTIAMKLRADVAVTQESGSYQNVVTITGTMTP